MPVQTPLAPSKSHTQIEDGVIEDARARQRRHRYIGWTLAVAVVAAGVIVGMAGGGGGAGRHAAGQSPNDGSGAGPGHPSSRTFPGAPVTQPNGYGVETGACPLAPPSRYLPARSGCVTVKRADVNGDGRLDLILVYSRLSGRHPSGYVGGVPPSLRHDFVAEAAFLKVVFANGTIVSARLGGARAAAIDSVAPVNDDPGQEIFLEVGRVSSGATGTAYGYDKGRLVSADVLLAYGGDSTSQAGFNCLSGRPPRLVQRTFELIGPTMTGAWRETTVSYLWDGPKLAETRKRTFSRHGKIAAADLGIGHACIEGIR